MRVDCWSTQHSSLCFNREYWAQNLPQIRCRVKRLIHLNLPKNEFFPTVLSRVVSIHADSLGFICQGCEISVTETSYGVKVNEFSFLYCSDNQKNLSSQKHHPSFSGRLFISFSVLTFYQVVFLHRLPASSPFHVWFREFSSWLSHLRRNLFEDSYHCFIIYTTQFLKTFPR